MLPICFKFPWTEHIGANMNWSIPVSSENNNGISRFSSLSILKKHFACRKITRATIICLHIYTSMVKIFIELQNFKCSRIQAHRWQIWKIDNIMRHTREIKCGMSKTSNEFWVIWRKYLYYFVSSSSSSIPHYFICFPNKI